MKFLLLNERGSKVHEFDARSEEAARPIAHEWVRTNLCKVTLCQALRVFSVQEVKVPPPTIEDAPA